MKKKTEQERALDRLLYEIQHPTTPIWVQNVQRRLTKMQITFGPKATPNFIEAAMFGYRFAYFRYGRDVQPPGTDAKSRKEAKENKEGCEVLMERLAAHMHYTVIERPIEESAEFLRGFAHGIQCHQEGISNPKRRPKAATTAWEVYDTLYRNQSEVSALRSPRQVHDWLCSKLGAQVVGDFDRTKKLCDRLGIKFVRRGPPQ